MFKYLHPCSLAIILLSITKINGLATGTPKSISQSTSTTSSRRDIIAAGWAAAGAGAASLAFLATPTLVNADEGQAVLSDDEMAARIAYKQALKSGKSPKGRDAIPATASDIRSDVNPDAGVNLRSRSLGENAKNAMEKQKEMKGRNKSQKREDLCEMLGRGC